MLRVIAGCALAFALSVTPSFAQQTVAVSGTVKDASGGVLRGATVNIVVADQVVATVTTAEGGRYQAQVAAGVPFQVRTHLEGFADQVIEVAGSSSAVTRDVALQIGRVSDRLSVTASRAPESLAHVTESVTIATSEDIQALGASGLADLMRFVPGIAVDGNGRDDLTSMFARGGDSDYNLVLIDGVRVNQSGGSFDFGRVNVKDIDRVEIVRGSQSSLWGSDAMVSVVQVFTKRAGATDAPSVSGSIEGGTFKTFRGDVRVRGGALNRLDYSVGIARRQNDGAFADILPEDDTFEQDNVDATAGIALGSRATARGGIRYSTATGHAPGAITFGSRDTGTAYDTKDLSWHVNVAHTAGSRYTGNATVNGFRYESRSVDKILDPGYSMFAIIEGTPNALFPNGMKLVRQISHDEFNQLSVDGAAPGPNQYIASFTTFAEASFNLFDTLSEFRRPGVRYNGDFLWGNGQRLSAGWEWERELRPAQTSPGTVAKLSLNNNAFFVQQQLSFLDRWFVTAGVRGDAKDTYDTFISPKLSAGGFLLPVQAGAVSSVKVFGNIGKGIKSPSFTERTGGGFADSDPDLKVERARTADIGVEATFADQRIRTGVTYFDNDFKDQIAFVGFNVGDGIPDIVNIDGSQARGVEFEVALQRPVAGLTGAATYSLVDTEVVENVSTSQQFQPGQPLLRRPKHSGTFRVGYVMGRLSANFDTRWIGDRHDNSFFFPQLRTVANATRPAFSTDLTVNPGYVVAGFGVDYRVDRRASIHLRVNNVGDTVYDSALGYPGLPRNAMVGVRFDVSR